MKQHRIKFLAVGLTMVFLLSGCGGQAEQGGTPSFSRQEVLAEETDQVDEMFADVEASRQEGSLQMGFVDSLETVYSYTGEPLCIPFSMQSSGDVGLILLVDGILQPFTVKYPDGTTRKEAAMQMFSASETETKVNLVFQPVTGKQGDRLSVMAATIWEPQYLPENEENPAFGNYHALSAALSRKIDFQADSAGSAALSKEYEVKDIPQAKLDELAAWDSLELLNSSIFLSIDTGGDSVLHTENGQAMVTVQLYGIPNADICMTLMVNNKPVKVDGSDGLLVHMEKNRMAEITVPVDGSLLSERNCVYVVASLTSADEEMVGDNPVKSESVLLIHKEGK